MQIKKEQLTATKLKLTITASQNEIDIIKAAVLAKLGADVKVQGFRPGKAPVNLIEKQLDQSVYQSQFMETAINELFTKAVQQDQLRPVAQPAITISKFVPFTALEFNAEVEAVGDIKLPDYKKIKLAVKPTAVTAQDVNQVLDNLRGRAAAKKEVQRAAKNGDEVTINFKGVDAQTKEAIAGADGNDYPLVLGSSTFIPGFEEKLAGVKPGAETTFTLTFPKDYGVKDLQSRKVSFTVKILKVQELAKPKLDDAFAASVGPFKTLAELKKDIKKQLTAEQQQQAQQAYDNELLEKIAAKTTVDIPEALIEDEINRLEDEEKRNIVYRGQTWQEHLDEEGVDAAGHRAQKRPAAETRVKVGLVLGEVANQEKITVTPEELEIRMQLLKGQYPDPAMQAELDKPEARRDIHSRMMTEKTLEKLRAYAASSK
ncbi:MAG TPA: trigger factor [Candidatus Saccharimonadales bacterium]|nr:trigger factor [Candidatus Saccharimonadales bacterium]